MADEKTAVIKFDRVAHGGRVRGAVNGQAFDFPVDTDVTVTEAQLSALSDSGATFATVTPLAGEDADEGSSASSTVEGTAIRLEVPAQPATGEDGKPVPAPELRQLTDKELTGGADQQASQDQAETAGGEATGSTGGSGSASAKATSPRSRAAKAKAK